MSTAEVKASIDSLNEFIEEFQIAVRVAKDNFKTVIKDKSIPLKERWELFVKAPTELREKDNWIQSFKALDEALGSQVSWYDDFNRERHETVYLLDIVSDLEYLIKDCELCSKRFEVFVNKPELLDQYKEEILEKNIESFEYDW
jgi:hypothetical protein